MDKINSEFHDSVWTSTIENKIAERDRMKLVLAPVVKRKPVAESFFRRLFNKFR